MTNEAKPMPTGCFQSSGGPLPGQDVATGVWSYLPSRFGPRKFVQYALREGAAGAVAAPAAGDAVALAWGTGLAVVAGAAVVCACAACCWRCSSSLVYCASWSRARLQALNAQT
jgi:hypothetical protein